MPANLHHLEFHTFLEQHGNADYFHHQNHISTRSDLFTHAWQISQQLPENNFAINLCSDRYLFTVAFLAVLLRRQINLLPANKAVNTIKQLQTQYPQSYCITDNPEETGNHVFLIETKFTAPTLDEFPFIDIDRIAVISFTSGSTGKPKAVAKTWREFQNSALLAIQRLQLNSKDLAIVSTVPPQHTYGLETSLFWPLLSHTTLHSNRPFFPEDIRKTVASSTRPCLLVSTPTHIKACVRADLQWHNICMVLSSTAPLSADLAQQAEHCFNAPLLEIFGSTETLSYASRRQTVSKKWEPYPGIRLIANHQGFSITGGHLQSPEQVEDLFEIDAKGRFTVLGRSAEFIKVAGKRTSLSELNRIINTIPGIGDAMFFQTGTDRLGALVVGKLSKSEILQELKQSVDEVFLPRPLYLVDHIPRNEVGKIIKSKLDRLLKEQSIA